MTTTTANPLAMIERAQTRTDCQAVADALIKADGNMNDWARELLRDTLDALRRQDKATPSQLAHYLKHAASDDLACLVADTPSGVLANSMNRATFTSVRAVASRHVTF